MALNSAAIELLFQLKQKHGMSGTVCQLGKQTVLVSQNKVLQTAAKYGYSKKSDQDKASWTGNSSDEFLFKILGFEKVESFDADSFEGSTYQYDFNNEIPEIFHQKYDCIIDGGTLEHIFNTPQALKNIRKMLKIGGVIVHISPTNNYVDHGFYMFSPTFFYDYYCAYKFEILNSFLFAHNPNPFLSKWEIMDYKPLSIEGLEFGGWGKKMLGTWIAAKKTVDITEELSPMQSRYKMVWEKATEKKEEIAAKGKMINFIKNNKKLYLIAYEMRKAIDGLKFSVRTRKKPKIRDKL